MKSFFKIMLLLVFIPTTSYAATIDFNSAGGSPDGYIDQGVTFTYNGTGSNFYGNSPNGTKAQTMSGDNDSFWRADIAGGASYVQVDLGDYNSDADQIFLSIFDSADNLLASITQDLESSFTGMYTLSLLSSNIAYALYGTTGALGLGGIYSDNFTYTPATSAVPVPAAIWLMGSGLISLFGFSRRKAQKEELA